MNRMPYDDAEGRLYTEREVGAILRRAAAQQKAEGPEAMPGLTLAELQQIAAELDIDPRYVAAAAAGLGADPTPSAATRLLGGPVSLVLERVVPGEITEAQWDGFAAEIRRTFHQAGTSSHVGRTYEWTFQEQKNQVQVTVSSRDGKTHLRVFRRDLRTALLTYIPTLAFTVLVAGPLAALLPALGDAVGAVLVLLLGCYYFLARFFYARGAERRQREAEALLGRLAALVPAPASEETAAAVGVGDAGSVGGGQARIDPVRLLDDAGAPETGSPADTAARRERTAG